MSDDETEYRQSRFQRPPGACEIVLVRHGESAAADPGEPFDLVDGHGDPPLHPDGIEQAKRAAARLVASGDEFAAVYVTTLQRTVQTARPFLDETGLTATVEADLREVRLGDWEGGSFRKHVAERHPVAVDMYAEERWDVIPNAEPAEDFAARVRGAIQRLAERHADEMIVVFTHGGVIGQVMNIASQAGRGFAFTGAANASISHVVVHGERWMVRRYNDTGHLDPSFGA